eukprot:gene26977-biopygen14973
MTLGNVQDAGLEIGTATQETQVSPEVGLIPFRYIPSSCADSLLAAMDSETRQTFRAVSRSCRQSVNAFTSTLTYKSSHNPRQLQESMAIPFSNPKMTLVNVQESGLEVGTATQEQLTPEVGPIPYRCIPSCCAHSLLAAMDSKTRQNFRAAVVDRASMPTPQR